MGSISKTFTLVLFLVFIASLVALPQNAKAPLPPAITLSSIGITETTITLSWTSTDFGVFTSYTLYMSTASNYANGHPFTPIWSTSDKHQTNTTVSNLSPSSEYYFYILDSGAGEADSSNLLGVQTTPNPTLWIRNKTATTASLEWSDYNNYSSWVPFDGYIVEESTNASNNQWSTITDITNQSEKTYTINVSDNETYARICYVVGNSTVGDIYESYSNIITIENVTTANPTPNVPEFPLLAILPLFAFVLSVAAVLRYRKSKSRKFD